MKKAAFTFHPIVCRKNIQIACFLFCFMRGLSVFAQKDTGYLDISKIQFSVSLQESRLFEFSDSDIPDNVIYSLQFDRTFSSGITGKNIYIKLSLSNSSDSVQEIYFSPGFYFSDLKILKSNNDNSYTSLLPINKSEADGNLNTGFILFMLYPKEKADFYLKPAQLKSGGVLISPQVINKNFIDYYKSNLSNKPINLITYAVAGMLLMMIFYSLSVYFQNFKPAFFYYSAYAFFIGLLIFLKSYLYNTTTITNYYFEAYFDFMLEACGFLFYIGFIREFLQTAQKHLILEKIFKACQWSTIVFLIGFSIASFTSTDFFIPDMIEDATKFLLVGLSIFFIIYGLSKNDKVMNYLVVGQIMLIIFSILSFVIASTNIAILKKINPVFNEPLLYYETGIVLELIFFVTALAYRNKKDISLQAKESVHLKLENERNEIENKIAVLEAKSNERHRISADMHDELGSGVTAIRLMSEIVKRKMIERPLPEVEKISYLANDLLDKMNTIVWTINNSNDSAESLIVYIRLHAVEFFESSSIDCRVSLPLLIPSIEINGEKRRNIFLSVKESLNNVVKHAHARHVHICIRIEEKLMIEITDDGIGINTEKLRRFGNGISNIKKRMDSIGGEFEIKSGKGTTVILSMKL